MTVAHQKRVLGDISVKKHKGELLTNFREFIAPKLKFISNLFLIYNNTNR